MEGLTATPNGNKFLGLEEPNIEQQWALPSPLTTALVTLLSYPTDEVHPALLSAYQVVEKAAPAAAALSREAVAGVAALEPWQAEELYCQTFDFSKSLTLEIGWHLFGEDYHRGAFLVQLRELQYQYRIPNYGVELPDHLANLLLILDAVSDEKREELAAQIAPALEKILTNFGETDNPYAAVLRTVAWFLQPSPTEEV